MSLRPSAVWIQNAILFITGLIGAWTHQKKCWTPSLGGGGVTTKPPRVRVWLFVICCLKCCSFEIAHGRTRHLFQYYALNHLIIYDVLVSYYYYYLIVMLNFFVWAITMLMNKDDHYYIHPTALKISRTTAINSHVQPVAANRCSGSNTSGR